MSWADARLAVDVASETKRERREYEEAERRRREQERNQGWGGSILSFIGGALFGPIGMLAGDVIGTELVDTFDDAEDYYIGTHGKFSQSEIETLNRSLKEFDDTSDENKMWKYGADILSAYTMSGGDGWTSFGEGKDAVKGWSVGGKEQAAAANMSKGPWRKGMFRHFLKNPEFYKSVVSGTGAVSTAELAAEATQNLIADAEEVNQKSKCVNDGGTWDPGRGCIY